MTGSLELGESTAGHLQAHTMEKPEKENTATVQPSTTTYPYGWRLHAISFGWALLTLLQHISLTRSACVSLSS